MKKISIIIGAIIMLIGCGVLMFMTNKPKVLDDRFEIESVTVDKGQYKPGEPVTFTLTIKNKLEKDIKSLQMSIGIHHLDEQLELIEKEKILLKAGENTIISHKYTPELDDFTGYLGLVKVWDSKSYSEKSIGFDVASDWRKFPRYGYVCRYEEDTDVESIMETMNRYHINAIEYYDWHYLHHKPIPDDVTKENPGRWQDWSGRWIDGQVIQDYITAAKDKNMVNMAYNMIYGATDSFVKDNGATLKNEEKAIENPEEKIEEITTKIETDGTKKQTANPTDWQIYFAKDNHGGNGEFKFRMGSSPSGNGNLYFMNPLNKEWQEHIFREENKIFSAFDFDGWHGDTVGDWGKMVTAQGEPLGIDEKGQPIYTVKETYTQFLNTAKQALNGKYLTFNPVGAQGIEKVNVADVDALYAEFWPWDKDIQGLPYSTYYSLVKEVERSMEESKEKSMDGKGKSLAVKAYINYHKTHGFMNEAGVLLADAAVYAAGGSRLELGDGDRLLHVEYYPDNDILMSEDLKDRMKRMSDFVVAYENVLRDGQQTTDNKVVIEDVKISREGDSNRVWAYTRKDDTREMLHLINLLGTDKLWRDEKGKKKKPIITTDLKVTYYTDKEISKVTLASPDAMTGEMKSLDYKAGQDDEGSFISFQVPSLEYWDMIIME